MRTSRVAVGATAAAVVGGGMLLRQLRAAQHPVADGDARDRQRDTRWRAVTLNREPDQVAPGGQLPQPLAALGDRIETRIRPAPGGKGTELAARLVAPPPSGAAAARARGSDPRQELRSALREAKQLLEVGEVLAVDPTPHGRRSLTPMGLALEAATRRADREGVL